MALLIFICALIMFVALVVVHELGHALVARRNGVKVKEFGIGFPPRIKGKKLKNGTLLSINWLPLGGFVRLKGESDDATGPGTYGGTTLWNKTKILMAGVAINWLTAVVILTILALVGIPRLLPNQFTVASDTKVAYQEVLAQTVGKDSPAARMGLQPGDQIISVAGRTISKAEEVAAITKAHAGKSVQIVYSHKDHRQTKSVKLNANNDDGKGYLGISPLERSAQRSTWSAPIVGVGLTGQLTGLTFQGIGSALGNLAVGLVQTVSPSGDTRAHGHEHLHTAGASVSGPVGIFILLKDVSAAGVALVLYFIAVISLTLAVMNVLPIPALDGGRLFFTLIFHALKKPLTKEVEESIHGYGFTALLILIALITVVDIRRFF